MRKVLLFAIILMLAVVMGGCKVKTVVVPEVHDVHHYHTDSIYERDSIFSDRETVVMQLDSAAMAEYGIRLEQAERVWLVRTKDLERRLQQMASMRHDSVYIVDSVPVPYPVIKEVPAPLTWWQEGLMHAGIVFIVLMIIACIIGCIKIWNR